LNEKTLNKEMAFSFEVVTPNFMKRRFRNLSLLFLLFSFPLFAFAEKLEKPVADHIIIEKKAHRMTLYRGKKVLKTYRISLGRAPIGPKEKRGDHKTPEGHYVIDGRNPNSAYHLSLHISYPTPTQTENAEALGLSPGGQIMIHGLPNGMPNVGSLQQLYDWTDGCVAVTNSEMDEVWNLVPDGTPVDILP
jgi:murein L,D-transpeptidase YafK